MSNAKVKIRGRKPRTAERGPGGLRVGPGVNLTEEQLLEGARQYTDWHWGIEADQVVDWDDSDMPETLIECGRLVRLQLRLPRAVDGRLPKHPRYDRDTMVEFSQRVSPKCHIAFDPDHKYQRLYLLLPEEVRRTLVTRFWTQNRFEPMPLDQVAQMAGGHHQGGYPAVEVKPVGILTAFVYWTHKKGDELPGQSHSYYLHRAGEVSGIHPIICCDEQGRLWLAGSNSTSPTPGVTD